MRIRERTGDDLDECVRLFEVGREEDGYPPHLPGDLRAFVASPDALRAWVAEHDGAIVGHVALHRSNTPEALEAVSKFLDEPIDRFGVVARLLVAPEARRDGVARSLLEIAARDAVARGLVPMLDVIKRFTAAISLYERCGWIRAGEVILQLEGSEFEEFRLRRTPLANHLTVCEKSGHRQQEPDGLLRPEKSRNSVIEC